MVEEAVVRPQRHSLDADNFLPCSRVVGPGKSCFVAILIHVGLSINIAVLAGCNRAVTMMRRPVDLHIPLCDTRAGLVFDRST